MSESKITVEQVNELQIEQMSEEKFKCTIWYIWQWNLDSEKNNHNYKFIVVSGNWINNIDIEIDNLGEIKDGPFFNLTSALKKCIELN